jgi:DNA primase
MATYSAAVLDDIRAGVDIVDFIGRFVNLRKAGVNWKGLCPFHGEKTPSFMVNPKKGIFHCFGCGVGGDIFGFLMRQDRLSFPEAVRALAKTAGVALPEERGAQPGDSGREELFRAMDLAARFYAETLWKPAGERARTYLAERGIDPDVARRFGIGAAPEGWDRLLDFMKTEKIAEETLIAAGLVVQRDNRSGVYDRFRNRLLFTIRDLQSRVVAFGGRAFGDEQPKYLNSPETPLYTKGNLLYAADVARESMRAKNRVLIVEGYVDCLMAHQHGFPETVAALGTAFTPAQLALLRRYCDEVVTFFDADAAGQKAAERAEELLEPTSGGFTWAVNRSGGFEGGAGALRVKVALLPAGHDPDTFLRAEGAAAFAERIAGARSLLSYVLERTIRESDGAGPRARTNAFARVALMLSKVGDAEEAAALSREAAVRLGVDATQLWIEAQRLSTSLRKPPAPIGVATTAAPPPAWERDLVTLLLASAAARGVLLPLLDGEDLAHAALREVALALRDQPDADSTALLAGLPSEAARNTLSALLVADAPPSDAEATIEQFRRRLDRAQRLRRLRAAARDIAERQQASTGTDASLVDALRDLERESKTVYGYTRAVGLPHPMGPEGPQGVQAHE